MAAPAERGRRGQRPRLQVRRAAGWRQERGYFEVKAEAPPRLKLVGVSKSFPGVRANDNVSLSVKPGRNPCPARRERRRQVHPRQDDLRRSRAGRGPDHLRRLAAAHRQPARRAPARHRHGVPAFLAVRGDDGAGEHLARPRLRASPQRELLAEFNRVLETYHLKLDPRRVVSTLSVGERQRIEIVRALLLNPRLLIMDEPTSVLTPQEVEQLFETLKHLASSGCSILYISHKLHEIVALCDTATILRGGKVVAACDPKRETSRSMAEMMIGANLKEIAKPAGPRLRPAQARSAGPQPAEADRIRRRAEGRRARRAGGRDFRRRRRRRQRPERAL